MQRFLTAIANLEWLILLAVLPLILFPSPGRSLVLLVIPVLWLVRKWENGRFTPLTPLDTSLLLLSLTLLLSLYASYDLALSLPKVIGVVYGIALFYAITTVTSRSPRHLQVGLAVFLLAGLAIVLTSLIGTNWGVKLPGFSSLVARMPQLINNLPGAVDGFNSNEVAGTLLWFVPLSLALALSPRILSHHLIGAKMIRPIVIFILWGFVVLTTATFILTQSRSGYLAFIVAGIFILWGLLHQHKLLSWGLLMLVIGLGTAFISLVGWQQLEQLVFAFSDDAISAEGITLTGRTEIWVRAMYAIEDFPITGVGMNLFRYIVPVLYPFFTLSNEINIAHAHNQFLQAGVDLGIPGLIAYVAIWLGLVGMLRQSWRWSRDAWGKTLTIGFTASLTASFIFGLTDAVSLGAKPGFMFWFLLGLIVGHYRLLAAASRVDNGF